MSQNNFVNRTICQWCGAAAPLRNVRSKEAPTCGSRVCRDALKKFTDQVHKRAPQTTDYELAVRIGEKMGSPFQGMKA